MRASPCSLLQFFSRPRPGLPWHRPLCHHCPAERGSGYFKKDASPEGSDDFGEGEEGTVLGLLPPSRLTQPGFYLGVNMSGCFQAASFPKPERLSGPTQGVSFHKGSFPDYFLGDLCVWARLGTNTLLLGEMQCWPLLLLCALRDTVLVSLQSLSTSSTSVTSASLTHLL